MKKRIQGKNIKESNETWKDLIKSGWEIEKSKKEVDANLLKVLKKSKKRKEETTEEKLLRHVFKNYEVLYGTIDKSIENVEEMLLESHMNPPQRNMLKTFLIKNFDRVKSIPHIIKFFENHELLNCLSYESLLKLLTFNLTEKELDNLITLANNWCQTDMMLNDILESVDDKIVFSDDITDKVLQLSEIISRHDNDSHNKWVSMNLWIEDYIFLKDIELSEELINKIQILIEADVELSVQDLNDLDKLDKYEIDRIISDKLTKLNGKTTVFFKDLATIQGMDIDENLIRKIETLKKLWLYIYSRDLLRIQKFTEEDINKLKYINRLRWKDITYIDWAEFVLKLGNEEINKIIWDIKKLWLQNISYYSFGILYGISESALQYCIENNIKDITDINKVKAMYSLSDKEHMRNYILRKNEYLKNNRMLSEEKYNEYFWWKWKYDKYEINQWNIWLCYLYSWLEIFKKMNWFAELIQTNFIENTDNWLVRFPVNVGSWIKVNKNEIDWIYETTDSDGKIRKMNINSKSEYLWFKILEIAYIKSKLINRLWIKKWNGTENNPLDVTINWENLKNVEWGDTIHTLQDLLSEDNMEKWYICWYNIGCWRFKRLSDFGAPEVILQNSKRTIGEIDERINKVFNLFWTWFLSIELSMKPEFYSLWDWVKKVEWVKDASFIVNDAKVVDKFWQEIPKDKLNNIHDILRDESWNMAIKFITKHAYSVWKCYVDENWEKRVRVVNPRHTGIKFDLSLDQCKKLFDWEFWAVHIDKMFR